MIKKIRVDLMNITRRWIYHVSSSSFRDWGFLQSIIPLNLIILQWASILRYIRGFIFVLKSIIPANTVRKPSYSSIFTSYTPSMIPAEVPCWRMSNIPMQDFTGWCTLYSFIFGSNTTNSTHSDIETIFSCLHQQNNTNSTLTNQDQLTQLYPYKNEEKNYIINCNDPSGDSQTNNQEKRKSQSSLKQYSCFKLSIIPLKIKNWTEKVKIK